MNERQTTGENAYREWRRGEPDCEEIPTADFLRKRLGGPGRSWERVKEELAGAFRGDVRALRLLKFSGRASAAEIEAAARAWKATATRPLRLADFVDWCNEQACSPDPEYLGWVRIQKSSIYTECESWAALLEVLGEDEEAARARGHNLASNPRDGEALAALVRAAARELNGNLNETAFNAWLTSSKAPEIAALGEQPMSWHVVERYFGSVPRLLFEAGAIDLAEYAYRLNANRLMTRDEQFGAIAAFLIEHGSLARETHYPRWRRSEIDRAAERGDVLLLPKPDTFTREFGRSWPTARTAVLAWMSDGGQPCAGVVRNQLKEPVR